MTAFVGMRDVSSALDLLDQTRSKCGDAITGFELISRRCLDFCLQHIPDTRDPLGERHSWYTLIELQSGIAGPGLRESVEEAFAAAFEADIIQDATIAESESQALALWKLRESLPEAELHEGGSIKHDVSVPLPDIPQFLEQATQAVEDAISGVRVVAFGHLGDGNIHFNVGQPEGADKVAFLARWAS